MELTGILSEETLLKIKEIVMIYGLKILLAIVIFVLGRWVAKFAKKIIVNLMEKGGVEKTLISFTSNLIYTLLFAFVIIAALSQLGIETTSFVALLGAAGLAVGMALQGSLSNFAAGVMMVIFKPFKVGDVIDAGGTIGLVNEIGIFTTILKTPDNKTIIIPNAKVTSGNIINYSAEDKRRIDLVIACGYKDDIKKVKTVLMEILEKNEKILKDPAPVVALSELAESSINFVVRPWVNTADYWDVYFDIMQNVKLRFDEENISIPYPQTDVHLFQEKSEK